MRFNGSSGGEDKLQRQQGGECTLYPQAAAHKQTHAHTQIAYNGMFTITMHNSVHKHTRTQTEKRFTGTSYTLLNLINFTSAHTNLHPQTKAEYLWPKPPIPTPMHTHTRTHTPVYSIYTHIEYNVNQHTQSSGVLREQIPGDGDVLAKVMLESVTVLRQNAHACTHTHTHTAVKISTNPVYYLLPLRTLLLFFILSLPLFSLSPPFSHFPRLSSSSLF